MTTNEMNAGEKDGPAAAAIFRDPGEKGPEMTPPDGNGDRSGGGWMRFLIDANPLYLLSVLMMIAGLYLVSSAASGREVGVGTVAGFFGIQNVYEIVLVAMAIYLLRTGINSRHGKLLLLFVMVFLADLTFYQVRIAAMDPTWGFFLAAFYLLLGAAKVGAIISWLEIRPQWDRLVYPLFAFGMIYFAPQYLYSVMDSVGVGRANTPFAGQAEVYLIWLVAAAIQLPVIVSNWRRNTLEEIEPNPFFGDANSFYRALLLFPFVALAFQLDRNVMADAASGNGAIGSLAFVYVPYLLAGVFFVQSFIRSTIGKYCTINGYDAVAMLALTLLAWATSRTDDVGRGLTNINWYIIIGAHLALVVTRKNLVCAAFLAAVALKLVATGVKTMAGNVYEFGCGLSTMAWAGLLMAGSFISLALGFLVSLTTRNDLKKS
ncbi:MAG TPA: hypothetical protein PKM25_06765 [Candidatus Ozemobacteraceae bacterium]|nr:hypothetical protein [Candidatus Ozemobacteraceae bacterium]